jgi:hypothetical protein
MGCLAITRFIVREEHSVLKFGMDINEYEQFIQELLNANKQLATLHKFLK